LAWSSAALRAHTLKKFRRLDVRSDKVVVIRKIRFARFGLFVQHALEDPFEHLKVFRVRSKKPGSYSGVVTVSCCHRSSFFWGGGENLVGFRVAFKRCNGRRRCHNIMDEFFEEVDRCGNWISRKSVASMSFHDPNRD
jgi:hypothetical protein